MENTPWNQSDVPSAAAPLAELPFALRPLSTGEVLDRSFSLYKLNFWLFAGIAAIPAAVSVLFSIARIIYATLYPPHVVLGANPFSSMLGVSSIVSVLFGIAYLIVDGVAKAATTSAVSSVYLGKTTSTGAAYSAISPRWQRWVGISLWQAGSAGWAPLLVVFVVATLVNLGTALAVVGGLIAFVGFPVAFVFSIIFYIRNSLAIPAGVMEGTDVRTSMARSKQLVSGRKGRIFMLFLLYIVLALVVGVMQAPLIFLALKVQGVERYLLQAIQLFISFIVSTLVTPIPSIGLCLFYFDERVRREGFDVEYMMSQVASIDAGPVAAAFPTEG